MNITPEKKALLEKAFSRSIIRFSNPIGSDLIKRTGKYYDWWKYRIDAGLIQFFKMLEMVPSPESTSFNYYGEKCEGVNYGNQDYLSLSSHPAIAETAIETIHQYGPHSAGSGPLQGNTRKTRILEEKLRDMLKAEDVLLYPTGWAAGFGVTAGLVRKKDHVLIDSLAHQCLRQGAYAATDKVLLYDHLNADEVESLLKKIREKDSENGILVITEGLFSMDSDIPDIKAFQDVCHQYSATLMLDIAHDFGAIGPGGLGSLGMQNMVGKVDLVMGSFSKTFASNGGFVASNSQSACEYLKAFSGPYTFSNMLSPLQAAVVGRALDIVRSEEGEQLRKQLMDNISYLREKLNSYGLTCLGEKSPIVPVLIGDEKVTIIANRLLFQKQISTNAVEFPGVPLGKARFRMQVMAAHRKNHAEIASKSVYEAVKEAKNIVRENFPD